MISIEQVPAYIVWPIRQKVMYPKSTLEEVKLKDDVNGIHFALFTENELTSVVSVFIHGTTLQLRKFATITTKQGMGFGGSLLNYVINFARQENIRIIWCNARSNASSFYNRFGFTEGEERYEMNGIDYIRMNLSISAIPERHGS